MFTINQKVKMTAPLFGTDTSTIGATGFVVDATNEGIGSRDILILIGGRKVWVKSREIECAHERVGREDYLNSCSSAACKLNGQNTYHLGCGSQWREYCADCGKVFYDSAQEEIDNVEWEPIEYICSQCEVKGVQPGHFACGTIYWVPA